MFESFRNKPREVQKAITNEDSEALGAMGRKGAQVAAKKRAIERDKEQAITDLWEEKLATADAELKRATNEDFLTPDGVDLDSIEPKD